MSTAADKDAVREELARIEHRNSGRLLPSDVVMAAQDPKSPLHAFFEWDDKRAAYEHRIEQARALIRTVKLTVQESTRVISAPYYVRDPAADSANQGYVRLTELRKDSELARTAVLAEFNAAAAALRRAREVAAVLELDGEIGSILEGVIEFRDRRLQQQPPAPQ